MYFISIESFCKETAITCFFYFAEIDECLEGTHNCDKLTATCHNTEDAFHCTCQNGYHGDGVDCEDIDECLVDPTLCHEMATCTNLRGSYSCVCLDGYKLADDGYTCNGKWQVLLSQCFKNS